MPAGRPPTFTKAEEMQKEIDQYFEQFNRRITPSEVVSGDIQLPMFGEQRPTITGLVLFLGFCGRQSFYDYEKNPEFSYTVKNARARIENIYEQMLGSKYSTGAIFALKNFEWTDKQEIEHSSSVEKPFILQVKPDKP